MIDPILFSQWVFAMGLVVLTPGPDSLLIMRNAANSGRYVGFASVIGVQIGVLFHTALVLFGVTRFLAGQPLLILAIGIGGGLFLVYLAWQTWTAGMLGGDLKGYRKTTPSKALRDAFLTNALNPKVILAFFAIMIPLISTDLPRAPQIILMGLTLLAINVIWQLGLVIGAEWFFRVLTNPKTQFWINRSVALVLLCLAVLLPFQAAGKVQALRDYPTNQPSPPIRADTLSN